MRILILFTFFITSTLANELPDLKNLVVHKNPKTYSNVIFLDNSDKEINIQNLDSQLIMLNFWATWCAPCREEMPSLDRLQVNKKLKNLKIYPINIGKERLDKVNIFFAEFGIDYLTFYSLAVCLERAFPLCKVHTRLPKNLTLLADCLNF